MTESEAKGFVQGKLDCMKKCDVFNKEDNISDNDCDNCEYCYSQGNFGNQKEAFQMAINALEKQIAKKPIMKIWKKNIYVVLLAEKHLQTEYQWTIRIFISIV